MTATATIQVALANETATAHLMADLALLVGPGDVITLSGDLGAGKTAAARAMIRYLAGDAALEVPSPTFTLAQSYDLPFPILHADLYRIDDASELEEIGLSPLPEAHAGADRMAGTRAGCASRGSASTSPSPIVLVRVRRACRRNYRPWQGGRRRWNGWAMLRTFLDGAGFTIRCASACPATPRRAPMPDCPGRRHAPS